MAKNSPKTTATPNLTIDFQCPKLTAQSPEKKSITPIQTRHPSPSPSPSGEKPKKKEAFKASRSEAEPSGVQTKKFSRCVAAARKGPSCQTHKPLRMRCSSLKTSNRKGHDNSPKKYRIFPNPYIGIMTIFHSPPPPLS